MSVNKEVVDEHVSGAGDVEAKPEPVPPKPVVPDVELIVDGFGFMPRTASGASRTKPDPGDEDERLRSACGSSSNIDVVRRYTWKTKNKMMVQVITYGATITVIKVPDKRGNPDDVIAGFDTLEEYFQKRNPYFGATIGRYANYIREATCVVRPSGRMYMLSMNRGHNHYNGGYIGFDKVNWRSYVVGNKVIMSHVSERFSEGYPGTVMTQITYEVTCDNSIKIEMRCTTNEPTIINLSHSPYFNLAGHHAGCENMYDHIFTINADKYTATDEDGLVTGERKVVGGTSFDFRVPRVLRVQLPKIPNGGYDMNFCITQGTDQDLTFHARALHPLTGRVLEMYSNKPGMQFYTGNLLPDPDKIVEPLPGDGEEESEGEGEHGEESESEDEQGSNADSIEHKQGKAGYGYVPLMGKAGTMYKKHGLFCLMPQNLPDAANHSHFPSPVLNPGEVYVHRIQYKFGLLLGKYV
ncbi:galactose mutarotase-like isoform X1 [Cydia amplana]|uniref:galactose mutarotase-like isoform X1 n=1 Tax=Cydia amplana TaxID=1869771 RepID=UPI002FE546B4